jgi:hypothetical protein
MSLLHPEGPRGSFPRRRSPTDRQARWSRSDGESRDDEGGSAAFDLKAPNRKENSMSHQPSRRDFLQSAVAALASFILPLGLRASGNKPSFWFIHSDTGDSWPVADPVQWSLENAREPILERASERLLTLTPSDGERILRLVTRRCKLNFLELLPEQVAV